MAICSLPSVAHSLLSWPPASSSVPACQRKECDSRRSQNADNGRFRRGLAEPLGATRERCIVGVHVGQACPQGRLKCCNHYTGQICFE